MVELACGTALPSIVALARGAKVTGTDISLLSLRLAEKSAEPLTKDNFSTMTFDIMKEPPQKLLDLRPDIVVASDLLYTEEIAKGLGCQLGVAASNGITVITTDAGRLEGQGQRIFLESFRKTYDNPLAEESTFVTEEIPDRVLDLGVNAMKYGGKVDRAVGVFEFPPPPAKNRSPWRWVEDCTVLAVPILSANYPCSEIQPCPCPECYSCVCFLLQTLCKPISRLCHMSALGSWTH